MSVIYKKKLSLFVAWFNILVSIAVPVTLFVQHWIAYKDRLDYFYSSLSSVLFVVPIAIPWLIASILLVKGIKENCPKLMAIWLYLGYLLAILNLGAIIYSATNIIIWRGSLKLAVVNTMPLIIIFVVLILSIIPVRRLYQRMSIPPPVEPTHIVKAAEQPMDVGPSYMPVFENV